MIAIRATRFNDTRAAIDLNNNRPEEFDAVPAEPAHSSVITALHEPQQVETMLVRSIEHQSTRAVENHRRSRTHGLSVTLLTSLLILRVKHASIIEAYLGESAGLLETCAVVFPLAGIIREARLAYAYHRDAQLHWSLAADSADALRSL